MASVFPVVCHEQQMMQHIKMIGAVVLGGFQPCGRDADVFLTEATAAGRAAGGPLESCMDDTA